MKFNKSLRVYGDLNYREKKCPRESAEQITFFNWLRREHPDVAGVAAHQRNEGIRTHSQTAKQRAEGMKKGASDIIIPASPAFVCELKRADHTLSTWQDGQQEYLLSAAALGAFSCVALGHLAAIDAFEEWRALLVTNKSYRALQ